MMSKPHRFSIGDAVVITEANLQTMQDSSRSCVTPNYPSASYQASAGRLRGQVGRVAHVFPPGYDISVQFTDTWDTGAVPISLHMPSHWVTPHPEPAA